jgi:hypothetical protein
VVDAVKTMLGFSDTRKYPFRDPKIINNLVIDRNLNRLDLVDGATTGELRYNRMNYNNIGGVGSAVFLKDLRDTDPAVFQFLVGKIEQRDKEDKAYMALKEAMGNVENPTAAQKAAIKKLEDSAYNSGSAIKSKPKVERTDRYGDGNLVSNVPKQVKASKEMAASVNKGKTPIYETDDGISAILDPVIQRLQKFDIWDDIQETLESANSDLFNPEMAANINKDLDVRGFIKMISDKTNKNIKKYFKDVDMGVKVFKRDPNTDTLEFQREKLAIKRGEAAEVAAKKRRKAKEEKLKKYEQNKK